MGTKLGRFAAVGAVIKAVRGAQTPGAPSWGERARAVPRMVGATLTGRYHGMSPGRLATLAAGAVYVISPVDFFPELILPLIGLGDDVVVLTFVVSGLLVETDRFLLWERDRSDNGTAGTDGSKVVRGDVVHGAGPRR